jgi:hypothetical protein
MNIPVFIGVTVVLGGGASYMMGQAIAITWRPYWNVILYAALLGLADRFITFALFDGELLSLSGYMLDTAVLIAIGLLAYRITMVSNMVNQYPWLYKRTSPLSFAEMGE